MCRVGAVHGGAAGRGCAGLGANGIVCRGYKAFKRSRLKDIAKKTKPSFIETTESLLGVESTLVEPFRRQEGS